MKDPKDLKGFLALWVTFGLLALLSGCGSGGSTPAAQSTGNNNNSSSSTSASQSTTNSLFVQSNQVVSGGGSGELAVPTYVIYNPTTADRSATTAAPFTPSGMRHAYGLDQLSSTGTGQTIAVVDAPGDPKAAQALARFCQTYGLAAASFTQIYASGRAPTSYDAGWGIETDLDIEWTHAVAPGANILLVVANSANISDLLAAVSVASSRADVVSMSWGAPEFSNEADYDGYFAAPGVTYIAASGDSGAGVMWPAVSTSVCGIGGTTLLVGSNGLRSAETAWSGSGGGISRYVRVPSYQSGVVDSEYRTAPDAAFDGNPATGVIVVSSTDVQTQVGGTSLGSVGWAALAAVINSARNHGPIGKINPSLYLLGSPSPDLFDIVSGCDGSAAGDCAHVGYDEVTGLGAPEAQTLVPSLETGVPGSTPTPTPTPAPKPSPSPTARPSPSPTPAAPTAPAHLTAKAISSTVIGLNWNNTSIAARIEIQYSLDNVHFISLGAVSGSTSACTIGGARPKTVYYFRLQAIASDGLVSPLSNVASVTTP